MAWKSSNDNTFSFRTSHTRGFRRYSILSYVHQISSLLFRNQRSADQLLLPAVLRAAVVHGYDGWRRVWCWSHGSERGQRCFVNDEHDYNDNREIKFIRFVNVNICITNVWCRVLSSMWKRLFHRKWRYWFKMKTLKISSIIFK